MHAKKLEDSPNENRFSGLGEDEVLARRILIGCTKHEVAAMQEIEWQQTWAMRDLMYVNSFALPLPAPLGKVCSDELLSAT